MEYKIKSINVDAEKVDDIVFPDIKDRVIEKHGEVVEFTINDIELNTKNLLNTKKELEAKREYENARAENVKHFHPFVLDMSEEDLFSAWMYKEATGWVKICDDKLKQIEDQLEEDALELAEIKKQIPELADIESPYVKEA